MLLAGIVGRFLSVQCCFCTTKIHVLRQFCCSEQMLIDIIEVFYALL